MSEEAHSLPHPPIRVLYVDDNPADIKLAEIEFRRGCVPCILEHAASKQEFLDKLEWGPDVVLTDFHMPGFTAFDVLALMRERNLEQPVIIVSGSIGEEQAVSAIKEGAFDYLLKDRLARLGPSVLQAFASRSLRVAHRAAELRNSRLTTIIEGNPDLVAIADLQGRLIFLNAAGRRICGIAPGESLEQRTVEDFFPEGLCRLLCAQEETAGELIRQGEAALTVEAGRIRQVAYTLMIHQGPDGRPQYRSIITRDLTERKRAEERVATLLRVTQKLNSILDHEELLDDLVREALVLLDADAGCAGVREGDSLRCRHYHTRHSRIDFTHTWPRGEGLPGWVFDHAAPYLCNDARRDPQVLRSLSGRFNVRQALCLPIQDKDGEVIGFFEIHNKLHGEFTVVDIELMQGVARSAAVALANALAYEEVRAARQESVRYAAGLSEIVELQQEINRRSWETGEVLNLLLNCLSRLVEADGAVIQFREGQEMVYRAATGAAAGQIGLRLKIDNSLSGLSVRENRSLVCHDSENDPRVDLQACRRIGLRSMIVVPFHVDGEVGGILKVYAAAPRAFSDSDQRLLEILSGLLGSSLQRQRAEDHRRNSEREFRALFTANPVPMWVFDSQNLRFMAVNEAAIRNYGYSQEEFLDMDITQIRPAEDVPAVLDAWRQPTPHKKLGHFRHLRKDGSIILAEISSDEITFRGRQARLVVAADVTKQKDAEEQIRRQARLLNLTTDAIIVRDMEGRIKFWNLGAEKLYGWRTDEVIGQKIQPLIYRDITLFDRALTRTLEHGSWQGELSQFNRDGKALTVASRWTLVRAGNGEPESVLVINTDITERKQLEMHFLRAQRMESIGTLAGGIAHDLNNILAPILLSIELLRKRISDQSLQNILRNIETSARRGGDIVKQVLTFARGVEGERMHIDLAHAISDIERVITDTFPKNIRFERSLPGDLWPLVADPTHLHQILLNLCVNARDAMPDGGELRIRASNLTVDKSYAVQANNLNPGLYVCLEVTDSGTGIPQEIMDKIFDPFFTTKEAGRGTGLGLSTVQAIVKSHGGVISVYSEPRNGTTFKVYLPAAPGHATAPADEGMEQAPRGTGQTILIVDDESSVRTIAKHTLEAFGYRVIDAGNGAEAVAVFVQSKDSVSLVVTDLMMPVMDGIATIHAIRKISPEIPIIATSGLNESGHMARVAAIGVLDFLAKPYDAKKLLTAVHQTLERSIPA